MKSSTTLEKKVRYQGIMPLFLTQLTRQLQPDHICSSGQMQTQPGREGNQSLLLTVFVDHMATCFFTPYLLWQKHLAYNKPYEDILQTQMKSKKKA